MTDTPEEVPEEPLAPEESATTDEPKASEEAEERTGETETEDARDSQESEQTEEQEAKGPRASGGAKAQGRFSLEQIRQMMLVEFERAQRHRYPIVCMVIAVDDFEDMIQVYGEDRKSQIMRAGFNLLREETSASQLQGLGCWTQDRLLAVLPHTDKRTAEQLAKRLVEGARRQVFERGGNRQSITFSIGVSRNMHEDTMSLAGLIRSAERGLAMAVDAGGDRFVHWREVETELEKIRDDLEEQVRRLRSESRSILAEAERGSEVEQTDDEEQLLSELHDIFQAHAESGDLLSELESKVADLVKLGLRDSRQRAVEAQMAEHNLQVDMLERRISKLTETLGTTEDALQRVAAMKDVEDGIASIYDTVQGLAGNDERSELKKELMAGIFQSNLDLKNQLDKSKAAA